MVNITLRAQQEQFSGYGRVQKFTFICQHPLLQRVTHAVTAQNLNRVGYSWARRTVIFLDVCSNRGHEELFSWLFLQHYFLPFAPCKEERKSRRGKLFTFRKRISFVLQTNVCLQVRRCWVKRRTSCAFIVSLLKICKSNARIAHTLS